jgi:hypothetical protein
MIEMLAPFSTAAQAMAAHASKPGDPASAAVESGATSVAYLKEQTVLSLACIPIMLGTSKWEE